MPFQPMVPNNGDSLEFCLSGVIFTIFIIIAFSAEKKYARTEDYSLAHGGSFPWGE